MHTTTVVQFFYQLQYNIIVEWLKNIQPEGVEAFPEDNRDYETYRGWFRGNIMQQTEILRKTCCREQRSNLARICNIKQQTVGGNCSGQMWKADTDTQSQACSATKGASIKY